jgi:LAS superfamily LD-carboxypeptidase LdcB
MALDSQDKQDLIDIMREGMRGASGGGNSGFNRSFSFTDVKDLNDELKVFTKNLKSSTTGTKAWINALGVGGPQFAALSNSMDQFKHDLEAVDRELKNAATEEHRQAAEKKKQLLESAKVHAVTQAALGATASMAGTLARSFWGATKTMLMGAADFSQGLLEGKSGNDLFASAMMTSVDATKQVTIGFADLVKTLGDVGLALSLIPGIGWAVRGALIAGSVAAKVFGEVTKEAADVTAELAKKGLTLLNTNVNQLIGGFKDVASAGGILSGGLNQLYDAAVNAGMGANIKDFAGAVKNSKDNLYLLGMSFSQGVNRMAALSSVLRKSNLGVLLDNLGYSLQEQAELAIETQARLKIAGDARANDEKYVAQQTVEYGKSLKVLNTITGGNAREALRAAQLKTLEVGLTAKAAAIANNTGQDFAEVQKKQTQQLAIFKEMGAIAETGFLQYSQFGVIADRSAALLFESNEGYRNAVLDAVDIQNDKNKTEKDAANEAAIAGAKAAAAAAERARTGESMATSAAAQLSTTATASKDLFTAENDLMKFGQKADEKALKQNKKDVDAMADNSERLNKAYNKMIENTAKAGTDFLKAMKPMTTQFLEYSGSLPVLMDHFHEALKNAAAWINQTFGGGAGKAPPPLNPPPIPGTPGASNTQASKDYNKNAAAPVAPRPESDKRKQQTWDSKFARGWNADGTAKANANAAPANKNATTPEQIQAKIDANKKSISGVNPIYEVNRRYISRLTQENADLQTLLDNGATQLGGKLSEEEILKHIKFQKDKTRFDMLNPIVKERFIGMLGEYLQTHPKDTFSFVSGFRTYDEQMKEWIGHGMNPAAAAQPGSSYHEYGRAIDMNPTEITKLGDLVTKYGFTRGGVQDQEHIQMETGGVVQGSPAGTQVTLAENNKSELVSPLVNGMLPGMKQLIDRVDTLISLTKSQNTTQGKMLRAVA